MYMLAKLRSFLPESINFPNVYTVNDLVNIALQLNTEQVYIYVYMFACLRSSILYIYVIILNIYLLFVLLLI